MATARKAHLDRTALDLVEEAARLLRHAPGGVLLRYYVGAVPCILGLLYFFTDVTRSGYATMHLVEASLAMAALYVWMKCWQTAANSGWRSCLANETPAPWSARRIARLIYLQGAVQPTGLFLRLVAANLVLPYVWVYSFYQGFGVFGDGASPSIREAARRAWTQAQWRPGLAHSALSYLHVFAFFVWLNVMVFILFAPQLLRIFTGVETVFTRTPFALFNTTVLAASFGITYLCFDPLRKALYVLRCFYGEAVRTGEDLAVGLKSLRPATTTRLAAAALLLLAFAPIAPQLRAAEAPAAGQRVDAAKLSDSIEDVLQRREYTWRLPREKTPDEKKGLIEQFIEELLRSIREKAGTFFKWLRDLFRKSSSDSDDLEPGGFSLASLGVLYSAIALSVGLIAYFLWKQRRDLRVQMVAAQAIPAVPDLRSDDVVADQLPEDGWLRLARELMDQGELRLALRASYLAGLAHLGHRELITIARHKSNLEYERELRRRARSRDELLAAFDENLGAFERAWYGLHEVTRETLGGFNANLEKIRAC
jgi:hypothetical protein